MTGEAAMADLSDLVRVAMVAGGRGGERLAPVAEKSGLLGLTLQLAKNVGSAGITVNAVLPIVGAYMYG